MVDTLRLAFSTTVQQNAGNNNNDNNVPKQDPARAHESWGFAVPFVLELL